MSSSYIKINSRMERVRFIGLPEGDFIAIVENYLNKYKIEYDYDVLRKEITAYVGLGQALKIKDHFRFDKIDYLNGTEAKKTEFRNEEIEGRKCVITDTVLVNKSFQHSQECWNDLRRGKLTDEEKKNIVELHNLLGKIYKRMTEKGFTIIDGKVIPPKTRTKRKPPAPKNSFLERVKETKETFKRMR